VRRAAKQLSELDKLSQLLALRRLKFQYKQQHSKPCHHLGNNCANFSGGLVGGMMVWQSQKIK